VGLVLWECIKNILNPYACGTMRNKNVQYNENFPLHRRSFPDLYVNVLFVLFMWKPHNFIMSGTGHCVFIQRFPDYLYFLLWIIWNPFNEFKQFQKKYLQFLLYDEIFFLEVFENEKKKQSTRCCIGAACAVWCCH